MRVLHFLSNSSIGGGQVAVASLIDTIRTMDQSASLGVVLPDGGPYVERFRSAGYETVTLPLSSFMLRSSRVREIIKRIAPDIVHTHGKGAGYHVRRSLHGMKDIGVVHNFHGFHPPKKFPLAQAYTRLENAMALRSDALVCVSESEANEVHKTLNHARGKIAVVQNCIDKLKTLRDADGQLPGDMDEWFERQTDRRVITMVARPDPVKNHDLACEAIAKVLQHSSQYAFLFIGLPPSDKRFKALIARFGDLVFASEGLPTASPAMKRSWALFLPSQKEGSPLVILEGFALGIPTIGARSPGITDILQDSWNGFLMDPIPEGLLNIIVKLETSPEVFEAAKRGAAEQGSFLRMRTWARQYLDIYRSAAHSA